MSMTGGDPAWVENRPTSGRRALWVRELWRSRELIAFLALRDVKVRYKQAVFGALWAIAQPLAGAAIFTLVFGRVAGLTSDGLPYILFAFTGFSLWTYLSSSVNTTRMSLLTNSALITKVYFPRLAAPLAGVLPALIDLGVAMTVLVVLCVLTGVVPSAAVPLAPLFLLGTMVLAFGMGTLLAALTVRYRDLQQVFAVVVQLWLYASPVAYSTTVVTGHWRWLYTINPMVGLLDGWRWSLLGGPTPGWSLAVSGSVTAVLTLLGLLVFQRNEQRFADVI